MTKRTLITRRIIGVGLAGVILLALLGLDLANRGLAWQVMWWHTGKEEPLSQVRGMVEWLGNFTRPQPHNDPHLPVRHTNVNPYGINTFLQKEPDPAKVEAQLRMIAEAGFGWIRQEFVWEDIEVDGRGLFTDSRNDMTGDGVIDTIDSWIKYDRIVDTALRYGIQVQARLSNPPAWSRAQIDPTGLGLPDDIQDFVNFAVATAQHFRGRVYHYQIWNEPNIFPEWGAFPDGSPRPVDPVTYTELLCRTYEALKAVDPQIVVISGALAPTSALTDRDLNDFVYLERMYAAGAGACFDVLSMQGYGLNSGPTDRRMRPTTVNFGRNQYIREMMVRHGDAHKPIWISEAAWNFVPTPEEKPDIREPREMFGQVTPQQAAAYMPLAYERMQAEWPWVGVMNYWFFTLPDDSRADEPMYYFRMVEPDYSPQNPTFTPLPVYHALRDHIASDRRAFFTGTHQLGDAWRVRTDEGAQGVSVADGLFGEALAAQSAVFHVHGTSARVRWQGAGLALTLDDGATQVIAPVGDGWQVTTLFDHPSARTVRVALAGVGDAPLLLDRVVVRDDTARNRFPLIVLGMVGLALAGYGLALARARRIT